MSNQRRPNAILEIEWLGLHWHWLRELKQHRTNRWQFSRSDEQNDIGTTPFVNVGPTKLPTKYQR